MTNNSLVNCNTKVLCEDDNIAPSNGSDHAPIVTEINIKVSTIKRQRNTIKTPRLNWSKGDTTLYADQVAKLLDQD